MAAVSSARYYREQAQLLLAWALTARDPDHATQLTAQAAELLNRSMTPDSAQRADLDQLIMEFNNEQMRPRLQQQQQQARDKRDED